MRSSYDSFNDLTGNPVNPSDEGYNQHTTTQRSPSPIPIAAYYTQKRIRVMRQIFVVTLSLFTGLFVMYMTYYYFIRIQINKSALEKAHWKQNHPEKAENNDNLRTLLSLQSLFDSNSVNIENCGNKDDFSCDDKYGCVSYESDIEYVLHNMQTGYVPLYHHIERETEERMAMESCFATQLRESELFCSDECGDAAYYMNTDQSNICKSSYLQRMELNSAPYRRACITALLSHQYSRMCGASTELANDIATAAFSWFTGNYKLDGQWALDYCPSIYEQTAEEGIDTSDTTAEKPEGKSLKLHYSILVH